MVHFVQTECGTYLWGLCGPEVAPTSANIHSVVATIPRCAYGFAGRVVHHHWRHPIIPYLRFVLAHLTIARLGVPADLHAALLVVGAFHYLEALRAPHVSGGVPDGLGQVGISTPSPKLLVVDEALRDVIGGIQFAPSPPASVLGYVLPLIGVRVVLDPVHGARVEQLLGVGLGVRLERRAPLEVPVRLVAVLAGVAPGVPIAPTAVVGDPPLAIAIGHARDPIEPELEAVIDGLGEPSSLEEFPPVDDELEESLPVRAANAVEVFDPEIVLAGGEAIHVRLLFAGLDDRAHLHHHDVFRLARDLPGGLLAVLVDLGGDADSMSRPAVGEGARALGNLHDGAHLFAPRKIYVGNRIVEVAILFTGLDANQDGKVLGPPVGRIVDHASGELAVVEEHDRSAAVGRVFGTDAIVAIVDHYELVPSGGEAPPARVERFVLVIRIWGRALVDHFVAFGFDKLPFRFVAIEICLENDLDFGASIIAAAGGLAAVELVDNGLAHEIGADELFV